MLLCTHCGHPNPDEGRFCTQCGQLLVLAPARQGSVAAAVSASPIPVHAAAARATAPGSGTARDVAGARRGYTAPARDPRPLPWRRLGDAPRVESVFGGRLIHQGVGRRLLAQVIDGIALLIVYAFSSLITSAAAAVAGAGAAVADRTPEETASSIALLAVVVTFVYPILFEGLLGGTIGKLALRMRVVDGRGRKAALGRVIVRNLMRAIDWLPLAYLLGAVAMASSRTGQRLGDRVAGTYVVAR